MAWQAGFDPGGAAMLQAVQCTRKWIGTTEAAALLRYFGCRALIVDFYGECSLGRDTGVDLYVCCFLLWCSRPMFLKRAAGWMV